MGVIIVDDGSNDKVLGPFLTGRRGVFDSGSGDLIVRGTRGRE